eukprot:TRINITY_DN4032_c0_g1_i8.p1 TRINITY_DN4032_c0_g1~~TRINITY_DN4032_c0_g1_i8.p1  ORF type:complete len:519 (-),score=152.68 TRINITY_DN4032_c0_g1_i8:209-1765(-)
MAAIGGHTTVLKYLLHQKGADPDAPEQAKMKNTGSSGINAEYGPLHSLINSKRVDLFEKKIEDLGGQVSDVDEKNISPLLHAAILGAAPFVKLLVEHQASLLEKTPEGRNAIHMAAIGGHTTVLKYLLHQKGADPDAPEQAKMKNTALHLAADANQGEACSVLIAAGANINAQNDKGDTPLSHALIQQTGAAKAVTALVLGGASVYVRNNAGMTPWEVAQRKDLCYSATTRNAFMKACDVVDHREFQIAEHVPQKQRVTGTNLSTDWTTATQFIMKCPKDLLSITVLAYSVERTDDCIKQVGFCVVKDKSLVHTVPSFQPEGIGFGGLDPLRFPMEKEFTYTICTYSTEPELKGDFGLCIFTPNGSPQPIITEAVPWKHIVSLDGEWKGKTAVGSAKIRGNPAYSLVVDCKEEHEVLVMLHQKTGDVSAIVFDENRIMPAKFYIGMYIVDATGDNLEQEMMKSEKWHNSKDVYIRFSVGGKHSKNLLVVPCTRMPDEELEFTISVHCDASFTFKPFKK